MNRVCKFSIKTSLAATLALGLLALPSQGQVTPVFYLNFSTATDASGFADVSGNNLAITVDINSVSYVPGGGPTLGGVAVDSAEWSGDMFEDNEIRITDVTLLDNVTRNAGSYVTWIKPVDGDRWNNILKTIRVDEFDFPLVNSVDEHEGSEFQASGLAGNGDNGVFGVTQGWRHNNLGPIRPALQNPVVTDTPSGIWTHIAFTWDTTGASTVYVNGVPGELKPYVADPSFPFGSNPDSDYWTIGGDPQNKFFLASERLLDGQLADFAIFGETLSSSQIAAVMTGGVASLASPSFTADFNNDDAVDGLDLGIWETAYGIDGSADADSDSDSDGADFLEWQRQFGSGVGAVSAVAAVPEPSSLVLCGMAALLFWRGHPLQVMNN